METTQHNQTIYLLKPLWLFNLLDETWVCFCTGTSCTLELLETCSYCTDIRKLYRNTFSAKSVFPNNNYIKYVPNLWSIGCFLTSIGTNSHFGYASCLTFCRQQQIKLKITVHVCHLGKWYVISVTSSLASFLFKVDWRRCSLIKLIPVIMTCHQRCTGLQAPILSS